MPTHSTHFERAHDEVDKELAVIDAKLFREPVETLLHRSYRPDHLFHAARYAAVTWPEYFAIKFLWWYAPDDLLTIAESQMTNVPVEPLGPGRGAAVYVEPDHQRHFAVGALRHQSAGTRPPRSQQRRLSAVDGNERDRAPGGKPRVSPPYCSWSPPVPTPSTTRSQSIGGFPL